MRAGGVHAAAVCGLARAGRGGWADPFRGIRAGQRQARYGGAGNSFIGGACRAGAVREFRRGAGVGWRACELARIGGGAWAGSAGGVPVGGVRDVRGGCAVGGGRGDTAA